LIIINVKKLPVKQSVTANINQLKQQKINKKCAITFAAHRHNVNVLLSNSTFWIFAALFV